MTQVVSSKPYCLEDSTQLTRLSTEAIFEIDGSRAPTIVDKHQSKRLYRLQRVPNVNTSLYLDSSNNNDALQGDFESIINKQLNQSFPQPVKRAYHRPLDVSNASMKQFTYGGTRLDPQQLVPSQATTVRNHPLADTRLRHEQGPDGEIVPRFNDRLFSDRAVRAHLGPGGTFNPGENSSEIGRYLDDQYSEVNIMLDQAPRQTLTTNQMKQDELARHFMYTSTQQAALDEIPWDVKLPPKLPIPLTTYEVNGSDPLLKPRHRSSFHDSRAPDILEWDRTQPRKFYFNKKPFNNVPPLTRAQQISGYSGSIGGFNLQDIDNPEVEFKPFTVVRTEQPNYSINPYKTNIPFYSGKTHWTKANPVSHYDQTGRAYTTTAAFHKSLPLDDSSLRHSEINGQLSRIVTTVMPQNPFNQVDVMSHTINASLDSRPHVVLRQLPGKKLQPMRKNTKQAEQNA